jgi:hypothetical protein
MIGDGGYPQEAGNPGIAAPDPEGPEVRAQQDALLHTAQGIRVGSMQQSARQLVQVGTPLLAAKEALCQGVAWQVVKT